MGTDYGNFGTGRVNVPLGLRLVSRRRGSRLEPRRVREPHPARSFTLSLEGVSVLGANVAVAPRVGGVALPRGSALSKEYRCSPTETDAHHLASVTEEEALLRGSSRGCVAPLLERGFRPDVLLCCVRGCDDRRGEGLPANRAHAEALSCRAARTERRKRVVTREEEGRCSSTVVGSS